MHTHNVSGCSHSEKNSAICHQPTSTLTDKVMYVLEKISLAVLGIFSALQNLKLFLPYMAAALAIGVYSYYQDPVAFGDLASSGCSQGFLEHLTGVKLPAPLSLAVNVATTLCHIDHHAAVFVPIVAIAIGSWIGKTTMQAGDLVYRNIVPVKAHKHA